MKNLLNSFVLVFLLAACGMQSKKSEIFAPDGKAIKGYDPVAFFKNNKPIAGADSLSYTWKGAEWFFSTRENLESFKSNPEQFAPQYGGYCAGEVAGSGSVTVNVDPEAFKIIDGKLYLIYDVGNAASFADNAINQVPKADANWPVVEAKLAVDQPDWNAINHLQAGAAN